MPLTIHPQKMQSAKVPVVHHYRVVQPAPVNPPAPVKQAAPISQLVPVGGVIPRGLELRLGETRMVLNVLHNTMLDSRSNFIQIAERTKSVRKTTGYLMPQIASIASSPSASTLVRLVSETVQGVGKVADILTGLEALSTQVEIVYRTFRLLETEVNRFYNS